MRLIRLGASPWQTAVQNRKKRREFGARAPGIEPVRAPRRNPLRDATLTDISLESQTKGNPDRFHPVPSHTAVWCRVAAT